MCAMTLMLASASPRRKQLLAQLGLSCEVKPQDIDESRRVANPLAFMCGASPSRKRRQRQQSASMLRDSFLLQTLL